MRSFYKKRDFKKGIIIVLLIIIIIIFAYSYYMFVIQGFTTGLKTVLGVNIEVSSNSTATIFLISGGNDTISSTEPFIIKISPPSGNPVTFILNKVATPINNTLMTNTTIGEKIYYTIWIKSVTGTKYLATNDTIVISQRIGNLYSPYIPISNGTTVTMIYHGYVGFIYQAYINFRLILQGHCNNEYISYNVLPYCHI
jgi:hypothetical protein